ncbi:hypothetical protein HMPREF3038_02569 [Akkermansia sp. KLE1797]|nr:hypothetical protein HMPREF3038_02569 [Akkermansia sp. KLE1797]KXU52911.1 hypothetical protein HMPREF3039_02927 [Akkermansia sp. KLE1798]KZA04488.1 hypothetical protein HMPREF1326_01835 [Akkermansia sp. KLE1605]
MHSPVSCTEQAGFGRNAGFAPLSSGGWSPFTVYSVDRERKLYLC